MKLQARGFAVLFLCVIAPLSTQSAPLADLAGSSILRLAAGDVDTQAEANLLAARSVFFEPDRRYVIQIAGPMTLEKRAAIERAGIRLGDYIPDNAYIVRLNNIDPADLARLSMIQWVGAYKDAWKIDPSIGRRQVPFATPERMLMQETGQVQLIVTLFEGAHLERAMEQISMAGADILGGTEAYGRSHIDLVVDSDQIPNIAQNASVQYVEEAPEPVMRNDTNEWILQSNSSGQTSIWDQGIHGEGQIGGVIDGPVKESHCSFDDSVSPGTSHRKIFYYAGSIGSDTHGTHVAGTMAGDQSPHDAASFRDGIAYAARFTFIPVSPIFSTPSSFILRLQDAHDPFSSGEGARIHTNSWGDDGTTSYTTWSEQIDRFSHQNEDDLVCLAVTNQSTLKTPENAKNVLAVGASQDTPNQGSHCSGGVGPTFDGRRKPEIYAPGCGTQSSSASTTCSWTGLTGTSMASPAIAGSALLVRQYYTDGFYPSGAANGADALVPSGALMKATLLNAAVNMTGVSGYPSNLEGWGRLLLDNSLYFSTPTPETRTLFVDDIRNANGLSTGEFTTYNVVVVDNTEPLRITLVWTDVQATVGTGFAPINDLDLEVLAPGGSLYLGNSFNTSTGESQTGGSRDDRNNVEQVHRLSPALGAYTVTVKAFSTPQPTQGYALVVTGGVAITPPDCNENGIPDDEDIAQGTSQDCDGNTRPDECDPDCDGNDIPDVCEIIPDCNGTNLPDNCDITAGTSLDCNGNDVPDECDVPGGTSPDCNGNAVPDECDVGSGTSGDCNGNNVPDMCDMTGGTSSDCNGNANPDECDIGSGTSGDCNGNQLPDECDMNPVVSFGSGPLSPFHVGSPQTYVLVSPPPAIGNVTLTFDAIGDLNSTISEDADVDINGTPFGTIFETGASQCAATPDTDSLVVTAVDYNAAVGAGNANINVVPASGVGDICATSYVEVTVEYLANNPADCNGNATPDECETDCNENSIPDDCDIAGGTSPDSNGNGIPDECDGVASDGDCDGDGDVDLTDFLTFSGCFTGGGGTRAAGCDCADMDSDNDVDLDDFLGFSAFFGGL